MPHSIILTKIYVHFRWFSIIFHSFDDLLTNRRYFSPKKHIFQRNIAREIFLKFVILWHLIKLLWYFSVLSSIHTLLAVFHSLIAVVCLVRSRTFDTGPSLIPIRIRLYICATLFFFNFLLPLKTSFLFNCWQA